MQTQSSFSRTTFAFDQVHMARRQPAAQDGIESGYAGCSAVACTVCIGLDHVRLPPIISMGHLRAKRTASCAVPCMRDGTCGLRHEVGNASLKGSVNG